MHHLWIQDAVRAEQASAKKASSDVNPADLVVKPLKRMKTEKLRKVTGFRFV